MSETSCVLQVGWLDFDGSQQILTRAHTSHRFRVSRGAVKGTDDSSWQVP